LLADFIRTVHHDLDPVICLRGDVFPDSFAPDSSLRVRTLEAMGEEYDAGETKPAPRRITCFFVDREQRRSGVAREALDGAFLLIAQAGGGEVVSFANELAPGRGRRPRSSTTARGQCREGGIQAHRFGRR
jgi:hypothetical protein